MVARIVETLVQAEIGRAHQDDGLRHLVTGALVVGAIRRLGPVGLILGTGYILGKAYIRRRAKQRIAEQKRLASHPVVEKEIYAETAGMLPASSSYQSEFIEHKTESKVEHNPA
ncbi:MAG: hypothetical protein ABF461_06915 [Zymomonas mobilis subsp. pomaceae]|uniref:Uncharacterized protein n=1 Tax=Zymomonas mobilis subsp. pomaceae (strain ATCC 29192 / DSM 22645 / JCM 10191 / CCUG 17912 / NBRC 13757 / NCIMB 11200 / NRRL B-4491 / Barker I) TaxID=579138 RepID=F8EW70_ZYMMT|nr:hypothetical protein [Zymomonas mobilis]AEI38480.1 hypothetical protein Zymop_1590 [Zymomonas mobilis subsp. pomaceae ATCC 29192]MDX5948169.1 hypothetical protein [Zymomonas mobilis subsp. pomaceae]GEB89891.1 hypothetical protein ZMO02_15280 [Zymomonas mobilis subsp. pomaceae]